VIALKPKESMSSFDLAAVVRELQDVLVGCRIGNIYQTSPLTFLVAAHPTNVLLIEIGRRLHLTRYVAEKPKTPSHFCMLLRKHLRRGIIDAVDMPGFERVILLSVASQGASYTLVFELFSRGTLILLDREDTILYASSYRKMRDRSIVRGTAYQLPPPRGENPAQISRPALDALKAFKVEAVRALPRCLAIGGVYAEEILNRAHIEKKTPANRLTGNELDRIYRETQHVVSALSTPQPHIVVAADGRFIDVLPFPLTLYRDHTRKEYPTFNEAADDYFTALSFEAQKGNIQGQMLQQIDVQRRILDQQRMSLMDFERVSGESQRVGNVIYAHVRELELLSRFIMDASKTRQGTQERFADVKKREFDILATDLLTSIDFDTGRYTVDLEGVTFDLSFRKSVYDNASTYYGEAKKAQEKLDGVKEALAQAEKKLTVLQQLEVQTEHALEEPQRQRKRRWFEKFHWAHSHDGVLIIGGRDASSNELLIKRHTNPDDVVLHADIAGAPFVVIKTEGKTPSAQTLHEAAQCAVSYSSAWQSGTPSLDAYWVTPAQVSKTAPAGEYLTRGAFMIYGHKHYLRSVPLQLSIGVLPVDDQWTIVGGPPSAITSQTQYHVTLTPGRLKSGRLAREVRRLLANQATPPLRATLLKLPLDEIQRFIPAGGGVIESR
jgi:predicted ribosome quality control (RQC) complex YloA/Tae2 family protein